MVQINNSANPDWGKTVETNKTNKATEKAEIKILVENTNNTNQNIETKDKNNIKSEIKSGSAEAVLNDFLPDDPVKHAKEILKDIADIPSKNEKDISNKMNEFYKAIDNMNPRDKKDLAKYADDIKNQNNDILKSVILILNDALGY